MLQPNGIYWLSLFGGGCALLYALALQWQLRKPLRGSDGLQRARTLLIQGGLSLLKWHGALLFVLVFLGFGILMALSFYGYLPNPYLPGAFLTGAVCALLPQLLDLCVLPRWAARSAAAMAASPQRGVEILLSAGRVRAFSTLGLTLGEVSGWVWFLYVREGCTPGLLTETLLTLGLGGAAVALFGRHLGLFSAAGTLGSLPLEDAGKLIPPEDLRNPASAAQALSACLHDPVSGLCAACRCLLPAAFALGLLSYGPYGLGLQALFFPLLVTGAGALATLVSSLRGLPKGKPLGEGTLYRRLWANLWLTLLLTGAVAMPFSFLFFGSLKPFLALTLGLLCAPLVAWATQLSALASPGEIPKDKVPVTTWMIMGMYGALPLLLLLAALAGGFWLSGGASAPATGLYGVALAGVGLLAPMGDLLTFSSFGALAQGTISLTWMSGDMAEPDWAPALDQLGDQLSADGRGYSLALTLTASLLLLLAWTGQRTLSLSFSPSLMGGILLGALPVIGVAALLLWGGKKATDSLREETDRQGREIKGLRSGKVAPHALSCVNLTAFNSLLWTVLALLLTVLLPLLTVALLSDQGALGMALSTVVLSLLPGFFLITAGDHWAGTPVANAVLPLRWAAGPALGELAVLVLAMLVTVI